MTSEKKNEYKINTVTDMLSVLQNDINLIEVKEYRKQLNDLRRETEDL